MKVSWRCRDRRAPASVEISGCEGADGVLGPGQQLVEMGRRMIVDPTEDVGKPGASAGHLRPPSPLWVSPIEPLEHIAELCRGDRENTIGR